MGIVQTKLTPIAEYDLDVGKFTYYPNFIIGEFKEGTYVTFESALVPIQYAIELYGDQKPIVYISHRINSYAMDPVSYKDVIDLFPNFRAFGIVAKNKRRRMIARLEKLFVKRPISVFEDMNSAMLWAEEVIKKSN